MYARKYHLSLFYYRTGTNAIAHMEQREVGIVGDEDESFGLNWRNIEVKEKPTSVFAEIS